MTRVKHAIPAAQVQAEVLSLLTQIGPMTVKELELCRPKITRLRLLSAVQKLRRADLIHLKPGQRPGITNPLYVEGPDPHPRRVGETVEAYLERQHFENLNPHLRDSWQPATDPAAAWLRNPTILKEPLHVEH